MKNRSGKGQGSWLCLLVCGLLLVAGCARTAPVSYYQLSPLEAASPGKHADATGKLLLGIGPVQLPEYLARPQIVTRQSSQRLQLADNHRWAEPLNENISRVLGENLSLLLGTERILLHPWPAGRTTDYQLLVEVLHFENESDGAARLVVRWLVKGVDGGVVLEERKSSYRSPATGQGQEGRVAALSETLASFCREIAPALTPLLAKPSDSAS